MYFIYLSIAFHIGVLIFATFSEYFNVTYPLDVTMQKRSEERIRIRVGAIKNTREQEAQTKLQLEKEHKEKQKAEEKKANETTPPPAAFQPTTTVKNKTTPPPKARPVQTSPHKEQKTPPIKSINNKIETSSKPTGKSANRFYSLEGLSEGVENNGNTFKSVRDVINYQFKNDLIEFFKQHWDVPDCLLGKNIQITVYIEFNRSGKITKYKFHSLSDKLTPNHQKLKNSVERLFSYLISHNIDLPVNGRNLTTYKLNFCFSPKQ